MRNPQTSRSRVFWLLSILLLIVAALAITLTVVAMRFTPIVRARAIKILEDRYQSKVTLQSLHLSLFPRVTVEGEGLEMRLHGRTDIPPMIAIRRFTGHAGLLAVLGNEMHVSYIRLEGLKLAFPPKQVDPPAAATSNQGMPRISRRLVIDEIDADGTLLEILPHDAGKEPLEFEIRKLNLTSAGVDHAMAFRAELTNPKPPGFITSAGHSVHGRVRIRARLPSTAITRSMTPIWACSPASAASSHP